MPTNLSTATHVRDIQPWVYKTFRDSNLIPTFGYSVIELLP